MSDPWNIGTLHKSPIWVFYALSNYVGVVLCGILITSVSLNPKRTPSDIFVGGLASGCLTLSLTCGAQCIANAVNQRFVGGEAACQVEAIAHVSSILTEFACVTCISLWSYLYTVKKREINQLAALRIVIVIWVVCTVVTGLASLFSPIYLMSAGTYCFFGFSSFAIAGWLLPGLVIALGVMGVCHYKTMRYFSSMLVRVGSSRGSVPGGPQEPQVSGPSHNFVTVSEVWLHQFRWRSTLFIIVLLLGWGFAAITAIYELAVGRATEWLVTAVGVGGVSFSWAMPVVYAYTCPHYRTYLVRVFGFVLIPCFGKQWWQDAAMFESRVMSRLSKEPRPKNPETPIANTPRRNTNATEMDTVHTAALTALSEAVPTVEKGVEIGTEIRVENPSEIPVGNQKPPSVELVEMAESPPGATRKLLDIRVEDSPPSATKKLLDIRAEEKSGD